MLVAVLTVQSVIPLLLFAVNETKIFVCVFAITSLVLLLTDYFCEEL